MEDENLSTYQISCDNICIDKTSLSSIAHKTANEYLSNENMQFSKYQIPRTNKKAKVSGILILNMQHSLEGILHSLNINDSIIIDLSYHYSLIALKEENSLCFGDFENQTPNHQIFLVNATRVGSNYFLLNSAERPTLFNLSKTLEIINEIAQNERNIYLILTPNLFYTAKISKLLDELILACNKYDITSEFFKDFNYKVKTVANSVNNNAIMNFRILLQSKKHNKSTGNSNLLCKLSKLYHRVSKNELKQLLRIFGERVICD